MDLFFLMVEIWMKKFSFPGREFLYIEQSPEFDERYIQKHGMKKSWVKNLWIFLGSLVIVNPSPVLAIFLLIFGTFFSFMLLDETE